MIDATMACLDQTGPAAVSLWTWTVAGYEIECLERLRQDQRITSGTLIIDAGARHKNAGLIRQWKDTFGKLSVRYVVNHAKIVTIHNEAFKLLLRGSMNLNFNPRFEQFDLTNLELFPGFIDVHNHGAVGIDVNEADADGLFKIATFLAKNGVTAWMPTLVPDSGENYRRAISGSGWV